ADTFSAMLEGDVALGIIVLDFPRADRCSADLWSVVLDSAADARTRAGKPVAILASLPECLDEPTIADIANRGLIPLCGIDDGLTAISASASLGQENLPPPVLPAMQCNNARLTSEREAKAHLANHGVSIPASRRATSPETAAEVASEIGFPVVLKREGLAHKTEAGGVRLNLLTGAEVRAAAEAMNSPDATFLVEEMLTDGIAELLVGVTLDPAFGYVLTIGAGGVLTELIEDTASLLIPSNRDDINAALSSLRMAKLLDGWRGGPAADRTRIIDAVMAVQDFVIANHGHIEEIEINPLICRAHDAVAADALIRMEQN
ncbi:MAG: acetate--CoA ligase family protein, partial [Pseudomonadota bacterium]